MTCPRCLDARVAYRGKREVLSEGHWVCRDHGHADCGSVGCREMAPCPRCSEPKEEEIAAQ